MDTTATLFIITEACLLVDDLLDSFSCVDRPRNPLDGPRLTGSSSHIAKLLTNAAHINAMGSQ